MARIKILIVDIDGMTELLIREFLGEIFEYQICHDLQHLLCIIEDTKPDLLICDAITPGESLREVCIKVSKKMPIVMLSSMDRNEERRICYLIKTHSYLTKPYSQEDLILSVNSALNNSNKQNIAVN